ncbi:MAG: TonB family protein [Deltaproteobacteria bacterium]|nr:TonB family protein [Deltaproteobacteria bacterium]
MAAHRRDDLGGVRVAMMRALIVVALVVLVASTAHAQHDAGVDAPPADAPSGFEPPRATSATDVPYPAGAPAHDVPIVVTVKLLVDERGSVKQVDLVTTPQPPFDDAVIAATRAFTFEPGKHDGTPVPVEITFTHTFQPPPPPPPPVTADEGPLRTSVLRGKLVQLGTRAPVTGATVTAQIGSRRYEADADKHGRFELPLPAGAAKITVTAPGHNVFLQQESLANAQAVAVTYFVEKDSYDPYEIVVVDNQRREEVSRITLRGKEIKQIPGTFGDPFRVVQTLPGVASAVSLLPFPIVRGASPSSTGFLLDGTRVPLLYHLLSGPSVIHPNFIDEIQFYPGGAPVVYGGYTGGIVDGRTARARRDEHLLDFDANLLQVGGLVRQPIETLGGTLTAAARYGYPGMLLSLATNQVSLSYWDYQLRFDGGSPKRGWTVFAFGAQDTLSTPSPNADPADPSPPLEPSLILGFHRLDLRYHDTRGKLATHYRMVMGRDRTRSNGTDFTMWNFEPSLQARYKLDETLTLVAGLEGSLRDVNQGGGMVESANAASMITASLDRFYNGAAITEALWRPTKQWLIRPGVRADVYADGNTTKPAIDPRLTARYVLARRDLDDVPPESDDSAIWLKGSAGIYHQPPRFVLPLPGLDLMPIEYGLLRSYQTSLGTEIPLGHRFQLTAEGFFNYMDPTIFDLSVNEDSVITDANTTIVTSGETDTTAQGQAIVDRLTKPQKGRAYGLEFLLRRQSKTGLFGWISYTLSRSERLREGAWVPYDFDRTHLLNVVAGLPLRRNWDVGLRLQYQSGKPITTTAGYNEARTAGYVRFDVRVDKRVVWRNWLLDFYVDVTNIALLPEEVTAGTTIRYVLPTVGVRGRF